MLMEKIAEYRAGRNFVRVGDVVRVDPLNKEHPFLARVTSLSKSGETIEVSVGVLARLNGNRHPRHGVSRTFTADRVSRVAQTKWEGLR